jgi:hypothetical protein
MSAVAEEVRTANIMQRVFDILRASPELLSVDQLCEITNLDVDTIQNALRRIRDYRALISVCQNQNWRYGIKASAERPKDRRGVKRRRTDRVI